MGLNYIRLYNFIKTTRNYNNKNEKIALANKIKNQGVCLDCGEKNNLQFHHLENKKADISHLARTFGSIKSFESELQKCVLLCDSCHKKRHEVK